MTAFLRRTTFLFVQGAVILVSSKTGGELPFLGAVGALALTLSQARLYSTTRAAQPKRQIRPLIAVAGVVAFSLWSEVAVEAAVWFTGSTIGASASSYAAWRGHYRSKRLFTGALRDEILAEFPECDICGTDQALAVDHALAWSRGGLTEKSNAQVLCQSHNSQKGARSNVGWRVKRILTLARLRGK